MAWHGRSFAAYVLTFEGAAPGQVYARFLKAQSCVWKPPALNSWATNIPQNEVTSVLQLRLVANYSTSLKRVRPCRDQPIKTPPANSDALNSSTWEISEALKCRRCNQAWQAGRDSKYQVIKTLKYMKTNAVVSITDAQDTEDRMANITCPLPSPRHAGEQRLPKRKRSHKCRPHLSNNKQHMK